MTSESRQDDRVLQDLKSFTKEVIAAKVNAYRSGRRTETSSDVTSKSFLDDIIEASEEGSEILTQAEIQDEVTTIILTGTETVTTTTAYLLMLLGMHSEHQDRIDQELAHVFGDSDRHVTVEDAKRLKHVEYCIMETLRLFPIVSFLPRELNEDVEISNGRLLPAGSKAIVFTWAIHRSAKHYPSPDSFCPDRWAPENSAERNTSGAYLPFGAGARMCLGYKYATMITQVVAVTLLRRYRVAGCGHTKEQLEQNIGLGVATFSLVGHNIQLLKKTNS